MLLEILKNLGMVSTFLQQGSCRNARFHYVFGLGQEAKAKPVRICLTEFQITN